MKHDNNFDALRLIAAFMVLVSHQFAISGRPEPHAVAAYTFGQLGVAVFFSISGYLIAASWSREPRLVPFAAKRLLRIWPGLAACVIVVGCLAILWMPERWNDALDFMRWNLIFGRNDGAFFPGQPMPQLNGSIWTIRVEMLCYVLVAALALLCRRHLATVVGAALIAYLIYLLAYVDSGTTPVVFTFWYMALFFMGVLLHHVPVLKRTALWFVVAGVVVAATGRVTSGLLLLMPAIVVMAGCASWPVFRRFGRFGDLSYGLYLWAWPVQQSVTWLLGKDTDVGVLLAMSAVTSLMLAFASWHLVEKRAIGFKDSLIQRLGPVAAAT